MSCARTTPCLCCQAGKPCAYVLQLDATQQAQIRRIEALIGTTQHLVDLRANPTTVRVRPIEQEPVEMVSCPNCGCEYQMLAYLAAFARDHRLGTPRCDDCQSPRQLELGRSAACAP